jgi:ribonuclease Z
MIPFEVTILGSNSAIPAHGRHPSAQWIQMGRRFFLMDCGEGTQMQCARYQKSIFKLEAIFISHLHGDHIFGLPGLLTTLGLMGRTEPLCVYGTEGLENWLKTTFELSGARFSYDLSIIEVFPGDQMTAVFEDEEVLIQAFPLEHRIQTNGYKFTLKEGRRHLDGKRASEENISYEARNALKEGRDVEVSDGRILRYEEWTFPGDPSRSYAYCSDTIYDEKVANFVKGCDLLYHEATYLDDMRSQAEERYHTTAFQAGQIAQNAGVGSLILGHASSRYGNVSLLEEEGQKAFGKCSFAKEGSSYPVHAPESK